MFVLNSDNNYTLVIPFSTNNLPPRMKAIVKRLNLYTPAETTLINNRFAIRMRPGKGDFVHIESAGLVNVDNYGCVTEPAADLQYNCYIPPKKPGLECIKGKEDVLKAIIDGEDGEVLVKHKQATGRTARRAPRSIEEAVAESMRVWGTQDYAVGSTNAPEEMVETW
jgi:hypothetical protein